MKIAGILFFVLFLLQGYCASAQGISPAGIDQKLDSVFAALNRNTPGVAVTVMKEGKVLSKKTYGMASIELQVPFTHQTVTRIGYSEAREFISIAAVLMEKDGTLSLTDKVSKYFPKLPEWSAAVTIWDLLNHRSGFVDEWATLLLMHGAMSNRFGKEQFLRLLYSQPEPEVAPGKGYMYSNSDFGLLRLILEKASGKKLNEWMKARIFDPLKMGNTRMQGNHLDIIPNRATKYQNDGNGFQHENVQKTSPGGNYFILTCADDLEKWATAFSDPGSEISVASVTLMEKTRMVPGKRNHFIAGYSTDTVNKHIIVFHEGVNGENYLSRIPSKGMLVITFGNLNGMGYGEQNRAVCDYMLESGKPPFVKPVFDKTPIPLSAEELLKYTGKFRWQNKVSWEGSNSTRKFSDFYVEDGKLKARYTGNYVIELVPVDKDVFYYEEGYGMQIRFFSAATNKPARVTVEFDDGYPGETMEKEAEEEWKPTTEQLRLIKGTYYSTHLDYYWHIEMNEKGKLIVRRATMPDMVIEPDGKDQFHYIAEKYPDASFDQWILFNRNAQGKITGFTIWSARVMHHKFEKTK